MIGLGNNAIENIFHAHLYFLSKKMTKVVVRSYTIMSIITHVNRDQSESFVKSFLIPWLSTIGDNIIDST